MNLNYLNTPLHENINNSQHLSDIQKRILNNRIPLGSDPDNFYYTTLDYLTTIDNLPDIDNAVEFIKDIMKDNGRIALVTDYDCDGITSAAVLTKGFKDFLKYDNIVTLVNKRRDGNGINNELLNKILVEANFDTNGLDLVITADHASSNAKEISILLNDHGIPTIITDHHIIPENNYPKDAIALINPHRDDSEYYHNISGCFVAFLLIASLYRNIHGDEKINDLSPLLAYVGISTISDMMPLDQPLNRLSVIVGLQEINKMNDIRWIIIKQLLEINTIINYNHVGFKIAPLINTGNRMDGEEFAFRLLVSEDKNEIIRCAERLHALNRSRKKIQKEIMNDAIVTAMRLPTQYSQIIPIYTEANINGILANQLGERFHKTTICVSDHGDVSSGSARAVLPGVDIVKMFEYVKNNNPDIIIESGGHEGAGGVKFHSDKIEEFRDLVEKYVEINHSEESLSIPIDMCIDDNDITPELIHELRLLEPYGKNWHEPIFKSKMRIHRILQIGSICKITFKTKNGLIDSIFFGSQYSNADPSNCSEFNPDDIVHVVFSFGLSDYRNKIKTELNIIDISKEIVSESYSTIRNN